jgi:aminoglycoside phosphotransferase (APT) family kinase protein
VPDKPAAEREIDEGLVRALVTSQATAITDAATLPLVHVADGWDCAVWRLGPGLGVRLPRRAAAAPLIAHEQRVLGEIARRLSGTGVGVPAPVLDGRPAHGYPWAWSIVPWFDGTSGLAVPRATRAGWAPRLAQALLALHVAAPADHPVNPVRGVPLVLRAGAVEARLASLHGRAPDDALRSLRRLWNAGVAAPPWDRPPVWLHGDLHPGNLLLAASGALAAVVDFGDLTAGDPATDLATAWLTFDASSRRIFRAELEQRRGVDEATWDRARGWALVLGSAVVEQAGTSSPFGRMGAFALEQVLTD